MTAPGTGTAGTRLPALEHCPLCHLDTEPQPGDLCEHCEQWRPDHDQHHGDHGCPQCDREAGYPR